METTKLKELRRKAELEIAKAAALILDDFQSELDDTISVTGVDLSCITAAVLGYSEERIHISDCSIDVRLSRWP